MSTGPAKRSVRLRLGGKCSVFKEASKDGKPTLLNTYQKGVASPQGDVERTEPNIGV